MHRFQADRSSILLQAQATRAGLFIGQARREASQALSAQRRWKSTHGAGQAGGGMKQAEAGESGQGRSGQAHQRQGLADRGSFGSHRHWQKEKG